MSMINLLPWREERNKKKKIAFFILLSLCCCVVLVGSWAIKFYIDALIDNQNKRNNFLENQTFILDKKIKQISAIKKEKLTLINRINLIQDLEQKRNLTTHLFNALPEITPLGIHLIAINFNDNKVSVTGLAESNDQVSRMVKNIENSTWLGETSLPSIVAVPSKPIALYKFSMHFIVLPKGEKK